MTEKIINGIIVKAVGGVYTVDVSADVYERKLIRCSARGVFRKRELTPLCGDNVKISVNGGSAVITELLPRRSELIRPPVANLDCLVFVNSTVEPEPDLLLLDKFIAISVYKGIKPVVVFTKIDKQNCCGLKKIYDKAGIPVFSVDNTKPETASELKDLLAGKISAFTGNTGVGKSSLLNNMFPELALATNEISKKLGRGKHTTRHVELYPLEQGGYIADTPGFSTFDTNKYDIIYKDELSGCFSEFAPFVSKCRFHDCSHTKEKDCAVIAAVREGIIAESRYENYVVMYEEAKLLKEWEHN